jgi:hypothetical protein
MSGGSGVMTNKYNGKYRTAILLAAWALGLFIFTLYSGLN